MTQAVGCFHRVELLPWNAARPFDGHDTEQTEQLALALKEKQQRAIVFDLGAPRQILHLVVADRHHLAGGKSGHEAGRVKDTILRRNPPQQQSPLCHKVPEMGGAQIPVEVGPNHHQTWVGVPMIKSYSDHAANERTYLAWVRTGIAIIAFGFVLERFDIFLHTITQSLGKLPEAGLSHGGREAGFALVVAGLVTLGISTWRFVTTSRHISSEQIVPYNTRGALALGGFIIVLGFFILLYIGRLLLSTGPTL